MLIIPLVLSGEINTRKVTQCFTFIREINTSVKRKTFVEHSHKHIRKASEQKFCTKTFLHKRTTKKEKGFMLALLKSALLFILNFPDKTLVKIWCLLKKEKCTPLSLYCNLFWNTWCCYCHIDIRLRDVYMCNLPMRQTVMCSWWVQASFKTKRT